MHQGRSQLRSSVSLAFFEFFFFKLALVISEFQTYLWTIGLHVTIDYVFWHHRRVHLQID